jgi:acetolactate synthase-1/3 small subunit
VTLPLLRTFIADVEDRPGTLNRVVSLFRRRNFNIESLTVGRTEREGVSRITLRTHADEDTARRIEANLYKVMNVLRVRDITHAASVMRELAFIKVKAGHQQRGELLRVCELFRARVVDLHSSSTTVEITGTQDKVHRLIEVLRPFGIIELVRTGAVAMTRGANGQDGQEAASVSEDASDEIAA